MIYRYTSSKTVITRLERYFKDSNWKSAAKLDLGDAIQEVGYASRQNQKNGFTELDIIGHKAELPCELEILLKVEYDGGRLPVTKDCSMKGLVCDEYVWGKTNLGDYYDIEYPLILTSFETGTIKIFYKQFEFDDEGFILIPDIAEYRQCLMWFTMASLLLQGYRTLDTSINHPYCIEMFDRYKKKAKNKVRSFSRDQRIAFSKMWTSLNTEYVESNLMDTE